jgi:hypothetical protein
MLRLFREMTGFALLVIVIFAMAFSGSCKKQGPSVVVPYIPPEYYDCIEAKPSDLIAAYYSQYGNMGHAEENYNNKYFVFKDQIVADWMIKDLGQGWIWLPGNIKCVLININDMKALKIGDRIDVVGYNTGPMSLQVAGLIFTNCYVLPAGTVNLPVGGGTFSPVY